jgi:hypothetical protein
MRKGIDHRVQGRAADWDGPEADLQFITTDALHLFGVNTPCNCSVFVDKATVGSRQKGHRLCRSSNDCC